MKNNRNRLYFLVISIFSVLLITSCSVRNSLERIAGVEITQTPSKHKTQLQESCNHSDFDNLQVENSSSIDVEKDVSFDFVSTTFIDAQLFPKQIVLVDVEIANKTSIPLYLLYKRFKTHC
ncbi:MAG: hypothetical protein ACQESK_02320 [Bacteroidota bacterium]